MTDKPVTDYYAHKYPVDEAVERSTEALLEHVNSLLTRIKTLETNAVLMRTELDSVGHLGTWWGSPPGGRAAREASGGSS